MPKIASLIKDKKPVDPSPGFFKRVFGTEDFTPNMQEGINIAKKEMPDMAPVQPYGFFSRLTKLIHPNSLGYANPGSIYLDTKTNAGQSPQDVADTLTHEQEHIKQFKSRGHSPTRQFLKNIFNPSADLKLPYHQRPDEMAAYQAEKDRRSRMGRPPSAVPSFTTGQHYIPRDVNLPNETRGVEIGRLNPNEKSKDPLKRGNIIYGGDADDPRWLLHQQRLKQFGTKR